jgi:hypothetical protein
VLELVSAISLTGSALKSWVRAHLRYFKAKAIAWLALLCFCAASFPLPVAIPIHLDKDSSQPFLCQNSPCGCKTAFQCWTSCCCNTPKQRQAWAEKNGVTPPTYAQKADSEQAAPISNSTDRGTKKDKLLSHSTWAATKKSCCNKGTAPTADSTECESTNKKDCCQTNVGCSKSEVSKPKSKRHYVLTMLALKCQGKSSAFTMLPWTILTLYHSLLLYQQDTGPTLVASAAQPTFVFAKPDTPPPKQWLS